MADILIQYQTSIINFGIFFIIGFFGGFLSHYYRQYRSRKPLKNQFGIAIMKGGMGGLMAAAVVNENLQYSALTGIMVDTVYSNLPRIFDRFLDAFTRPDTRRDADDDD